MKRKQICALILCSMALAGCTNTNNAGTADNTGKNDQTTANGETDNTNDSKDNSSNDQTSSDTPEVLANLVNNASDDAKAKQAWKDLLLNSANSTDLKFTMETDGEDYLFDENNADTLVTDHFIYDIGKDMVFYTDQDTATYVALTDVDDSYDTFITGYGLIDRYGTDAVQSAVSLSSTEHDTLDGTLLKSSTDVSMSKEDAAAEAMIDSVMDFGYVRTVTPITNSSLYSYDLKKDGNKWVLKLAISDLDGFKKQADVAAAIVEDRNARPVLVVDDIQSETFTFTFSSEGILEKEENDIYHVIAGLTDDYKETYMNLQNKAEFKKAETDELKPAAFDSYFASISSGELTDGGTFSITDWE